MHLIQYRDLPGKSWFQLKSSDKENQLLADFLNEVMNKPPSVRGWDSAVIRGENGLECSFGKWWPYHERSHEDRLSPILRHATVHRFGSQKSLVSILWETDPVRVLFTYPNQPEEGIELYKDDIEQKLEQAIRTRLHLLVGV
jgi:hypothetical protein